MILQSYLTFTSCIFSGRYRATRWVFGGCCPEQGIGFVVPVPNRQAITLEPQMIRHIAPGALRVHY